MAVVVPKPNRQLPINCTSVNKLSSVAVNSHLLSLSTNIICRCQQTVQLPPVPKPIQLKQTISPRNPHNEAKKCFKGNYKPTMYYVLCFVYCVLCIVCCVLCVVYCVLCITVLCCANNQTPIFSTKFNFFSYKRKNLFCVNS